MLGVAFASQVTHEPGSGAGSAAAPSPFGSTAEEAASRRAARSPEYRAQRAHREGVREIAWLLIKYRMDKGLSQEQLAELVGTSHSQISRIESGRHRTNLDTLSRIVHALDMRMVVGFETTTSGGRSKRDSSPLRAYSSSTTSLAGTVGGKMPATRLENTVAASACMPGMMCWYTVMVKAGLA